MHEAQADSGLRSAQPSPRGSAACSHGPQASEAGPGTAPAQCLERVRERSQLTRHPAMHAQRSTVGRPAVSAQWPDDGKVLPTASCLSHAPAR
jgi:hypothetical protein